VNTPAWILLIAISTVNVVSAAILPLFGGFWNYLDRQMFSASKIKRGKNVESRTFELTMLLELGMSPIGVGLQDPPVTCNPLVIVLPTQKPMKL
jgi:hypothetical protein